MTITKPSDTSLTPRQLEILDAAARVFAEHGYRSGTIQLVAKEAGLSQAGLIHHFPNKDAILLAVIEHRDREDREVSRLAYEQGASVLEVFPRVLEKNARRPELMRLFAVLSAEALNQDHPAHAFFQRRYRHIIESTTEHVKRDQSDGIVRDDLPAEEIARLVVAAADGLRYQSLIGSDPREHWEHLDSLIRLLGVPDAER